MHAVPEIAHETPEQSEEKFLQVVNGVLSEPLQKSDVVRAHRVGRRVEGRHRPLIARLVKSSHKYAILEKRPELRDKNFGVSGDLTPFQRQQIEQAKREGKHAYFRGGVLHTEARRAPDSNDSGSDRRVTRSRARERIDSHR